MFDEARGCGSCGSNNTYHIGSGNWFEWDNRQITYDAWLAYGLTNRVSINFSA